VVLSVGTALIDLRSMIKERSRTDEVLSSAWLAAPLIAVALGIAAGLLYMPGLGAAEVFIFIVFGAEVAALVIQAMLIYKLVRRRSLHFRRDAALREALIKYVQQLASSLGKETEVTVELATMNTIHSEAKAEEPWKGPVLWALLSIFIPFAILYVLYFLTKDPPRHDRRQSSFLQQAQSALSKLGKPVVYPSWRQLPERSFFLYLVLTIITGFFALYWYYVLIKDFNEHFKAQWVFEDELLRAVSG